MMQSPFRKTYTVTKWACKQNDVTTF
jgi:hypothetical protein